MFLYIAAADDVCDLHKVGISKDPLSRVAEVQKITRHKMRLLFAVRFENRRAAFDAEWVLKGRLKEWRQKKHEPVSSTEWFVTSFRRIRAHLRQVTK